jgi:hypothetical protein
LQARIVSFIEVEIEDLAPAKTEEKHVSHKEDRVVLREQPISNKIEILLLGFLDNPMIKCMRQLFNKATQSVIVSLAVKKMNGIQKFKLPFRNCSSYLDSDIEFAFIRTPTQHETILPGQMDPIECLSFYCQPN